MFQWLVAGLILAVWFVLKVFMHKSGYVHILLLLGLSIFDRPTNFGSQYALPCAPF